MSIRDRLKLQQESKGKGIFAVVGGMRLDGKSSIAGTLPGKTIMFQAGLLETGSKSAKSLAKANGNDLSILTFESFSDIVSLMQDKELLEYDNIYIDGLSAITEMRSTCDDFKKMAKKNIWDAYRMLGDDLRIFLLNVKKITENTDTNVFVTMAYKPKYSPNGDVVALEPDLKGNVTISEIQRLCPTVLAVVKSFDEEGRISRSLITRSDGVYPARVDAFLDSDNPGTLPASLTDVINLIRGVEND